MGEQNSNLADGTYPCAATLHVTDGKAVVVLHSMFGLRPGTSVPLLRREHDLKVESAGGGTVGILNGHAII